MGTGGPRARRARSGREDPAAPFAAEGGGVGRAEGRAERGTSEHAAREASAFWAPRTARRSEATKQ